MSRQNPHMDAALRYAGAGWPVFPCRPQGKVPAIPSAHLEGDPLEGRCTGECGRQGHGFHDATTDPAVIREWWGKQPDRNIGLATGTPGPDVLDVDTKGERSSGYSALNQLKRDGLIGRPQAMVRTPSGGAHLYFAGTDQRNGTLKRTGLDYRGQGGYVVAVPSLAGGKRYELVQRQASGDTCDWRAIRERLEPEPQRPQWQPRGDQQGVSHLTRYLAGVPEGNRNPALFWALNRAREAGDLDTVGQLADAAREAGLTEREIAATMRSAERTTPCPKAGPDREAGS